MGLSQDVQAGIDGILRPEWNVREGRVVPKTEDIALANGAVCLDATYLYADMADSTGLAQNYADWAVAKIVRCYLNAATRIIRRRGGEIRSFDGDRVMGIFVDDDRNDAAVLAAMQISWAVSEVIQPKLKAKWEDLKWTMKHGVGIDTGRAMLVRGGVFGDNDLISIGSAPNVAAKLSEQRGVYSIYISAAVHAALSDQLKILDHSINMWQYRGVTHLGAGPLVFFGTSYMWEPS